MTGKHENILVVGICGAAGAGKDTFADGIRVACAIKDEPFFRVSLADALKTLATKVFNEGADMFHGREKKEVASELLAFMSPRQVLQRLGAAGRDVLGDDVWINAAQRKIDAFASNGTRGIVAVPDIRYPNEAEWLRGFANNLFVRVKRVSDDDDVELNVLNEATAKHETEQHYPSFGVDVEYPNHDCGSLVGAVQAVAEAWNDIKRKGNFA